MSIPTLTGTFDQQDREGKQWWDAQGFMQAVSVENIIRKLVDAHPEINSDSVEQIVRRIIKRRGFGEEGSISETEFRLFLALFGPFTSSMTRCLNGLFPDGRTMVEWFHPDAGSTDCSSMLANHNVPSCFVMRYSSAPNAFTLHILQQNHQQLQTRVTYDAKDMKYSLQVSNQKIERDSAIGVVTYLQQIKTLGEGVGSQSAYHFMAPDDEEDTLPPINPQAILQAQTKEFTELADFARRGITQLSQTNARCKKVYTERNLPPPLEQLGPIDQRVALFTQHYESCNAGPMETRIATLKNLKQHIISVQRHQDTLWTHIQQQLQSARPAQPQASADTSGGSRYTYFTSEC